MTESKLELRSKVQCKNLIERVLQFRLQLRRAPDENQIFKSPAEAEELNELRIFSYLACVYRVMEARGKFGEHKTCVRVARAQNLFIAAQ